MAIELIHDGVTGQANYRAFIIIALADAKFWNTTPTAALEAYNASNIASYRIAPTEIGATGIYSVTIPATLDAGSYAGLWVSLAASATLTVSDVLNNRRGISNADWDGTNWMPVADVSAITAATEAAILDEGDATALLAAIAAKIEEFLINDGDATATLAAIATAVRTNLATELARIDADISSRAAPGDTMVAGTVSDKTGYSLASGGLDLTQLHLDWADSGRLDLLLDFIKNWLEADVTVDKSSSPWQIVIKLKGTATELGRKDVKDVDGTALASTSTVRGQLVEPA